MHAYGGQRLKQESSQMALYRMYQGRVTHLKPELTSSASLSIQLAPSILFLLWAGIIGWRTNIYTGSGDLNSDFHSCVRNTFTS